jgi:uncharacterized protein (DUF2235 family)
MSRLLIVCIDGTWNSSAEESRFKSYPTNVERISKLLISDGKKQLVIYRPGVGTRGYVDRVIGGVWGAGSTQLICDGYRFMCEHYEPGDRVALFGFSRGAFIVRSIVETIARVGILRHSELHYVGEAVLRARRIRNPFSTRLARNQAFSEQHCVRPDQVTFVGVWDTVIRYGPILPPVRLILEWVRRIHFGLLDQRVPRLVRHFCHALALDESRAAFWPWRDAFEEYWLDEDLVEEMWFAGTHSDVGGGYSDSGLSAFPLQWMIERAKWVGLVFHDNEIPFPSRAGLWRFLRSRRRILEDSDRIHDSVERRMRNSSYRPVAKLPKSILSGIMAGGTSPT